MAFKMKGPGRKRSIKEINKDPNVRLYLKVVKKLKLVQK